MPMWNPWRGCKKCSEGCLHCYIHKGDAKRGVDTSMIVKTKDFEKPVAQLKKGGYKMIKERSDCTFLFLTKRIERFSQCIRKQVNFEFRQCGTCFIKDGKQYKLQTKDLCKQVYLANINYKCTNK